MSLWRCPYFEKGARAEELCRILDEQRAASLEQVKQYADHPGVAVIHFGRASNVYLVVGKGGGGDGGGVSQMIKRSAVGGRYLFLDEPLTFLDIRHQIDFMKKYVPLRMYTMW